MVERQPSSQHQKRVCVGKCAGAHGVKGLVKIVPYCEDLSLLEGVLFTDETTNDTLDIKIKSSGGKALITEIKGINTREEAQKLKCSLFVSRETLPNVADSYYYEDLIDLKIVDNSDNIMGIVKTVVDLGAGDLLEIKPPSGTTYFIPFQHEAVQEVDLERGAIIIDNPEQFNLS